MTNSMFRQAWDDAMADDPLRDPRAEANARVKRYAHQLRYILTGFTFAVAGVLLALAAATMLQGEFDALSSFQPDVAGRQLAWRAVSGRREAPGRRVGVESKPSCQELLRACLPIRCRSVQLSPALPRP
jgi:hypothetical protein